MTSCNIAPLVSVCVVTYNQQGFIKDCLLSVLTQAFDSRIEILVGDDGSSDGTADAVDTIANHYPGVITLYRHPKNLGPSGNYQFLIERATGEYIAHLDGDDYWLPGKLEAQLRFLAEHPECVAAYTNAAAITESGSLCGVFNNPQPAVFDAEYLLRGGNFLNHSSMLYRASVRDALLSIHGSFIDYRMHLRLTHRGRLGYLNQTLVMYRAGVSQSMSISTPSVIRDLYWQALHEGLQDPATCDYAGSALARFWAHSLFVDLMHRKLGSAWNWARKIRREEPRFTFLRLVCGTLASSREFWRFGAEILGRRLTGSRVKVLHRRD